MGKRTQSGRPAGNNYKSFPANRYSLRRNSQSSRQWLMLGAAVAFVVLMFTTPLWTPLIRLIIPDRYILTYAPGPIQRMIFQIDPARTIPTPSLSDESAALNLLPSPTPAPTATATPTGGVTVLVPPPEGYIQPTQFSVEPTPTLTPVFAQAANDPRAEDRNNEADLSHADRLLTGFSWVRQGANNCGPASITVLMSYWGVDFTQEEAAEFLKPNQEDPNVRPDEIARFVESKGYRAMIRVNGSLDMIKQFILAGYPVMIETGYDPEPDVVGWTSHYLTIVGYSDKDQELIAMDTYRRPNWAYPYSEIETYWRQFNRRYIIVYRPDQAAAVASLVGADIDDTTMYNNAMRTAQLELSFNRNDAFGWFNLGSSLTGLGNYKDAVSAFDQARRVGLPSRFLWYQFTMFDAYLKVGGDYNDEAIKLADDVLRGKTSEEAFYYKAMAYAAQGKTDAAKQQLNLALRFNKHYDAARTALEQLGG